MNAASLVSLVAHYQRLQGLGGWSFTIAVVPGLTHDGDPAWATVLPDLDAKGRLRVGADGRYHAQVRIRDVEATPIPGFDGDVMREIRVTVSHELWHCKVREFLDDPSVENEETLVEAAAQAVVMSEGTGDARIMARSIRALPSALRARVSASAGQRAREGAVMEEAQVKEALEALQAGDDAKCTEILKSLLAALAVKGSGAAPTPSSAEPDGDEAAKQAKVEPGATTAKPVAPEGNREPAQGYGARVGARKDEDMSEDARRARVALEDAEATAAELKAIAEAQRPAAKEGLVHGLRARLGTALTPAAEKRIMDAPTYQRAKEIADIIGDTIGESGQERARSGATPLTNPGQQKGESDATLIAEGFDSSWIQSYRDVLARDPLAAAAELEGGRTALRARKATTGGADPVHALAAALSAVLKGGKAVA